jgi:hypothetical protein
VPRVRIPLSLPSVIAHPVRLSRPRTRTAPRRWRRRGRRAQVAAVATILGLLLVVTFIANYLTTQLPNQMSVNDLNHEVQVENQVGQLGARLSSAASAGVVGAQLSGPITLGSDAAPPFAAADSSFVSALVNQSTANASYTLSGPSTYAPPTGAPLGGTYSGSGICNPPTSTSLSFVGSCNYVWNFTGDSRSFSIGLTGSGSVAVIVTTNSSTITVSGTGSAGNVLEFIGNHNAITDTNVGSGPTNLSIIGSYNTISISSVGSSPSVVYLYGNHDSVTVTSTGSGPVKVIVYGTQDTFGVPSDVGSQKFSLYLNGFNATVPTSSLCPYGNLSSTDTVTGFSEVGSGGLTQYDNNAIGYYANGTGPGSCVGNATCWTTHNRNVPLTTCPFYRTITVPFPAATLPGAGFVVHMRNTYAPSAEIAYDEGAVVYAQPGGIPVLLDPPAITYSNGALSLFLPQFQGVIGAEAGIGTADLNLRLLSAQTITFPSDGYSIASGSKVIITVVTPYAAGWMAYLTNLSSFSGLVTCTGPQHVCTGLYNPGGPLGTIKIVLPAKTLTITLAVFSLNLN